MMRAILRMMISFKGEGEGKVGKIKGAPERRNDEHG